MTQVSNLSVRRFLFISPCAIRLRQSTLIYTIGTMALFNSCSALSQQPATFGQLISEQFSTAQDIPTANYTKVAIRGNRIVVQSDRRAYEFVGNWVKAQPIKMELPIGFQTTGLPAEATLSSVAKAWGGEYWVTTTSGNWRGNPGKWVPLDLPVTYKPAQPTPHQDSVIRQVINDASGHIWVATDLGVNITDGKNWWHPVNSSSGMPIEDVNCLAFASNGDVWGGTSEGAWRLRKGQYNYFWGKRWIPGNTVNAMVCAPDNSVWLATNAGVAHILEKPMTLEQKAAHYEKLTQSRHNRHGYVTSSGLSVAGDTTKEILPEASDNDGLWTAIYVGAESFRYAVTKDPEARKSAHISMEALLDLTRLSGYPGYPVRSIIRKGEKASGYDPDETVRVPGETDKIWYTPKQHPEIFCKGDTSSDELDGHYFAFYTYYNLVANDAEKSEIRKIARSITDNILEHDYNLIGHTGRKTRWAIYGPKTINDDPRWWDQRGLNSLQILTYLKITTQITGDQKYEREYQKLIRDHHYALNVLNLRQGQSWWLVNHSDDELSFLNFYSLFQIETDPAIRTILLQSLEFNWKSIRNERSPFYNFIYGASGATDCRSAEALKTLQDWPWDLVDWRVQNEQRMDVKLKVSPGSQRRELDEVLPMLERPIMRWNGNPYQASGGDGGKTEEDGSAWLICYWMGRYHKLIGG